MALRYHYETQPLPTWTSWYMHQLPRWFQALSIGFMFWAELIAPWFVFGPRRLRMVGFWSLVLLQVLIAATGNYGFFNVLAVVLCLSLVEDRDWRRGHPPIPMAPSRRRRLVARGPHRSGGGCHPRGDDDARAGSDSGRPWSSPHLWRHCGSGCSRSIA